MDPALPFRLVVATREDTEGFFARCATGRSIATYALPDVDLRLYPRNGAGLPDVYNQEIERARSDPAILVFIHDDVHICDFWWLTQLRAGLARFQLVGLCGNRRRVPRQPAWAFLDTAGTWDSHENLSGVIAHGSGIPARSLAVYGPSCQPVKLLDGLLLAARSDTFIEHGIRFEPALPFHFYDLDLCRQWETKALTMGTWSVSVVHESGGAYASEAWIAAYKTYLEKWGE
jgi:hypothetical protein